MSTTKIAGLLCGILCTLFSKTTLAQSNPATFTFTLKSTSSTSAGVYKKDSTLVRTLWSNKTYSAGTFTDSWDGKDDYGNTLTNPDAMYDIKVLSNNVAYNWDGIIGNTSSSQTGSGVHRGYYTSMTGMAITGNTAYFCQGYSEGYSSEAKFDITNPQVRLNIFGGMISTMNADFVATDGINVYWAGYDAYKMSNSFVHVTKVSDDSQVSFGANGASYTMQNIGSPKTYTSVIDKLNVPASKPSGLAVQQSGNYLFIAHSGLDELHVLDKTTGATIQTLAFTNPRYLSIDGNYLWMVTGTNNISKYLVNANGTLSGALLSLQGVTLPGAIQSNCNGTVSVIDQTNQVIRFFNTSTGAESTQLGVNAGYATSPDVTNTKYFFNDFRGNTFSFISYAPDGSFWLGDPGNFRELHFNAGKTHIETTMSMGISYSTCVDPNNIARVFGGYLEFAVDYSKPLTGSTGWTLIKNWGYAHDQFTNPNSTKRLLNVMTLSNGRTYGYDYNTGAGFVELSATGLRNTGVSIGNGIINTDGSLTKFSGSYNTGSAINYIKYLLTGFNGSNNPIWSTAGTLLATTPSNTMQDPNNFPGNVSPVSYNFLTKSNKVIFYNPSVYYGATTTIYDGYHLGAIKMGSNKWLWETQRANHRNYKGAFPQNDCFEIGNSVNQDAGSNVNVLDNNIITGYHGEFWKNSQTNYYNHYYEDGLAIGQFGFDRYLGSSVAGYGVAGNALSPTLVKDNATGDLYLYHGDESIHAGIHRWKISNLSSISEQYISVPFPTGYNRVSVGYLDLHSGLPFDSPLSNVAGWSTMGTTISTTSLKKYVNDGSPDVFSEFKQTTGSASVQRDLGTNNVTNSWKISGQVSFEGSDFVSGSQTMAYIDVLDAAGKILSRFYYSSNHATGITTVFGNTQVIAQSNTNVSTTLSSMQPFEVNIINNKLTFTYANYPALTAAIFDPSANWKSPKTLRAYFVSGFPAYGKNIGLMDMKFYKDYNQAINIPPFASAGTDQAITLPFSVVNLSGSGTDTDGSVVSYSWRQISGPSFGIFSNSNNFTTAVIGLAQGIYKFELKVTDNIGATGEDTVQVTVNAALNILPVADASLDQVITLPSNIITLTGVGTDADGTITNYLWRKISGPSSGTIANANNATTNVTSLTQGVYNFELKVTDNSGASSLDTVQVTVNATLNIPPVADAGLDQVVTFPLNSASLNGVGTDADGTITNYLWTKISGPSSGTITNANNATTNVTGLTQGVYKFELKVTDNSGAIGLDTVQVMVNAALNIPPVAAAGADQSITLPLNSASLTGIGTDADGTITNYLWTKLSGPSSGTITNANNATTNVTGLTQGVYKFEMKVTDNSGANSLDTVQVTVNTALNIPPVADAGADQSITLPLNSATLTGIGTDADGTITNYLWTKVSGPSSGVITNTTKATTTVTGLKQGIYKFELKVTDNAGATVVDTMQLTVNPAPNIPPVANAGLDEVITLPVNTVSLAGSGGDVDGSVVSYSWTKIFGPSSYTFVNSTSPVTDVFGLAVGVYLLELTVTDNNGAIAKDTMQITVNPVANIAPTADAGTDQMLFLPKNKAALNGSGSDVDGTVASYLWTEIAGPPSAVITNRNAASTVVTVLTQGDYVFELKVTDNNGTVGKDTVQLTVVTSSLPLKLLSFTGKFQNDVINLFWETTNEKNVLGFEIERMNAATWNKIGFVPATNGGLISNKYAFTDSFPAIGSNYYRLKIIDVDGKFIYSDIISFEVNPRKNLIYQNFPNPFSKFTTIKFEIAQKNSVKIVVYNSIGLQVATLLDEIKQPGVYQVTWNAYNVAQGNYVYKVMVGESVVTKKMLKMH